MSFKIISSNEVYRCRTFTVKCERVLLPNGREAEKSIVCHPGAVVVVPVNDRGEFFLESQYRHSLRRKILEFPAGTLEAGENPLTCAQRELQEELGLKGAEWISLGALFPAPGFCDELQHLFLARGLSESLGQKDEDELIEAVVLNRKELEKAIISGELCDAKSISAYTRAVLMGQFED